MGEKELKEKSTTIAEAYRQMTTEQKAYYLGYAEGVSDSREKPKEEGND